MNSADSGLVEATTLKCQPWFEVKIGILMYLGLVLKHWFRNGWTQWFWGSFPAWVCESQGRLRLDSGMYFFPEGLVKHCQGLPRAGLESPSLEWSKNWMLYFIIEFNCGIWSKAGLDGLGGVFQPRWFQEAPHEPQVGERWRGCVAHEFGYNLLVGFVTRGVCGIFPRFSAHLEFFPPEVVAQCQLDHPHSQVFCMVCESSGNGCPGRIWPLTWPFFK